MDAMCFIIIFVIMKGTTNNKYVYGYAIKNISKNIGKQNMVKMTFSTKSLKSYS
ncbi:hypothetical protein ACJX0J_007187, partial [Zea mays]